MGGKRLDKREERYRRREEGKGVHEGNCRERLSGGARERYMSLELGVGVRGCIREQRRKDRYRVQRRVGFGRGREAFLIKYERQDEGGEREG